MLKKTKEWLKEELQRTVVRSENPGVKKYSNVYWYIEGQLHMLRRCLRCLKKR